MHGGNRDVVMRHPRQLTHHRIMKSIKSQILFSEWTLNTSATVLYSDKAIFQIGVITAQDMLFRSLLSIFNYKWDYKPFDKI